MRGEDQRSDGFFSYLRLETRIPADHPLRPIRDLVDTALRELPHLSTNFIRAKGVRRSRRNQDEAKRPHQHDNNDALLAIEVQSFCKEYASRAAVLRAR
jgi:hypothetical protein